LPFPKTAKYRAAEALELVHGDLCGPITLATHGGRKYFILSWMIAASTCGYNS
jgi:hypothetical protein